MKRAKAIAEKYLKSGMFKPEIVAFGDQIAYEMEMDKRAMVEAISRLTEYLEYRNRIKDTHTFGDHDCDNALQILVKRVSEYSCPNGLKDEYKTKENCPLKDKCKCKKE